MKVYFVGAFSEGKTTIKKKVAERFSFLAVPEQFRVVVAEHEEIKSLSEFRINTTNVAKIQQETIIRQHEAEVEAYKKNNNIVACRSIDSLTFLAFFGEINSTHRVVNCYAYKKYVQWIKQDSLTFFLQPSRKLINNDGFRDTDWDLALQISGAVRMILEYEGVSYIPIETTSSADREKIIYPIIEERLKNGAM